MMTDTQTHKQIPFYLGDELTQQGITESKAW